MRKQFLMLAVVLIWMSWHASPTTAFAMRPGCGDGNCNTWSCAGAPTGTMPGDGCEEDACNCWADCEGVETYVSGDGYCDACHGELGANSGDCGQCGDSYCSQDEVCTCPEDCGTSLCFNACTPTSCGSGYTCSLNGYCISNGGGGNGNPNPDGTCLENGDACDAGDYCCGGLVCDANTNYECVVIRAGG